MPRRIAILTCVLAVIAGAPLACADAPDPEHDILVTFEDAGARAASSGMSAPYRNRKRYAMSADARRIARAVEDEYGLAAVDHWPIRSLGVYCFVYRVPEGADRDGMIDRLRADVRIESVQRLNEFETGTSEASDYDDTYANLQHGLATLDLVGAHRYSRGSGVRIAVIDSGADTNHEDLRGRIRKVEEFADNGARPDRFHGTAVTSVIAALANNAKGIVGVAPEADVELYVACWSGESDAAVCDSFSLAKAIDALLEEPPDILNLSLAGPEDPLLRRLLLRAYDDGVIIIAARKDDHVFPAGMAEVIDVGNSHPLSIGDQDTSQAMLRAPGERIIVALPDDNYDFRSGSSLAAAHVTGVVALLLAVEPDAGSDDIRSLLAESQIPSGAAMVSVNACRTLYLANNDFTCDAKPVRTSDAR